MRMQFAATDGKIPILVLIDVQREYTSPGRPFHIKSIGPSLENCRRMLDFARANSWPVGHVRHLQDGHLFNEGLEYSRFVAGFEPLPNEMLFTKSKLSCYSSEPFCQFMESARAEEVYLVGYNSQMCCLSTVVQGHHLGHRFNYVADASCARATANAGELDAHRHATDIIGIYARVLQTDEVLRTAAAA
jgi:nicotinamidase-related amidase